VKARALVTVRVTNEALMLYIVARGYGRAISFARTAIFPGKSIFSPGCMQELESSER
jgi:hypothetical protein